MPRDAIRKRSNRKRRPLSNRLLNISRIKGRRSSISKKRRNMRLTLKIATIKAETDNRPSLSNNPLKMNINRNMCPKDNYLNRIKRVVSQLKATDRISPTPHLPTTRINSMITDTITLSHNMEAEGAEVGEATTSQEEVKGKVGDLEMITRERIMTETTITLPAIPCKVRT
jgi:hypothetical protein